ncbi:MAG: hypothetical protein BWY06_01305 [Candidatus Latescibacteria bacterium ADurb.Bin168]|nr:MAG: hypothetical protein BWY06_01305 [Candidatus Latescibacteria bacterium ADurb.Bin168]
MVHVNLVYVPHRKINANRKIGILRACGDYHGFRRFEDGGLEHAGGHEFADECEFQCSRIPEWLLHKRIARRAYDKRWFLSDSVFLKLLDRGEDVVKRAFGSPVTHLRSKAALCVQNPVGFRIASENERVFCECTGRSRGGRGAQFQWKNAAAPGFDVLPSEDKFPRDHSRHYKHPP